MNKLPFFIFSTFFLLSSFSYGQGQACDNMKKLDELIKTENRNTDKYLAIKSARFYWWRRCQCESGKVVDQGGEKAIIEYLATGYDNSQWAKGKYSDIPIPNKRDFKTGDCFSTHEFKKTVDHTDCQSINYSTQEDPQRYITQYYIFRCMCEKGVNSESEAKQLVAFMDFNYNNANSYYTGKSLNLPDPLKKCSVVNFKSGETVSQLHPDKDIILNDEYLNLLNDIAADSKNPNFKTMVEGMNRNKEIVGKGRSFAIATGTMKQGDVDYYNNLENIAQGVEVAKFLYNSISNKDAPLSPEQQTGRKMIQDTYWELKDLYNEVKAVPTFYSYDETTFQRLESIKNRIPEYENATATRRLLYLVYWNKKPYLTSDEVVSKFDELETLKTTNGIENIKLLISEQETSYLKKEAFTHIVDKENGFKLTNNKLALAMAKYYKANGNSKKADQIIKSLNYDVDHFNAFKLLYIAYGDKNYYGSILYYEQVKEILNINEGGEKFFSDYTNIPNLDSHGNLLAREEASYLLGLGALSYLKSGELTQAENELNFLKWYNNNFLQYKTIRKKMSSRKKATGYSDTELDSKYNLCLAIEKTIEATILSKKGENLKAETLINEATLLNANNRDNHKYTPWILLSQLDISIRIGNLIEAKKAIVKLKYFSSTSGDLKYRQYSQEDYQFLKCFLKYKEGNLESVLISLEIMGTEYPNNIRIQQLKINSQLNSK
tara:strand:+ start:626 stop:2782 length:2157 start_codon:yes stop_codon:yes gene_type:complete